MKFKMIELKEICGPISSNKIINTEWDMVDTDWYVLITKIKRIPQQLDEEYAIPKTNIKCFIVDHQTEDAKGFKVKAK